MSSTGTITSGGVGSGIDVESLVQRLVAAEGQPKQQKLATDQARLQAKISGYGSFRSALAQLQASVAALKDPAQFRMRSASVADPALFTASAVGTAAAGAYEIEVVRLATAAKLATAPYAASTTTVGTGTLTVASGGKSFSVQIDAANATLAGIRDAINGAQDNPGISATLVNANDGVRLVLSSAATGAANAITVTQSGGDGGLAALVYDPLGGTTNLTVQQAAQDARIEVDGNAFDSATNSVSGAIDGVTINLLKPTGEGVTSRLTVAVDQTRQTSAINAFVAAYNQVTTSLRALGAYDPATQRGGVLLSDPTLRTFLGAVRTQVGSASPQLAGNAYAALSDLGITTNLDGTLKVDATKLNDAFRTNSDAVVRLFSAEGGVAKRLDALLTTYVGAGGVLEGRTKGLESSLKGLGERQAALNRSLAAYEARVRAQFTAMDTLVAQLRQTGQNLVAQLSTIQMPTA